MSCEIQALRNRIKRTESDIIKLQSEYQELLNRMERLENPVKMLSAKEAAREINRIILNMK